MRLKFIITFTVIRLQFRTRSRVESVIHPVVIWWLSNVGRGDLFQFKVM